LRKTSLLEKKKKKKKKKNRWEGDIIILIHFQIGSSYIKLYPVKMGVCEFKLN
jgi:hypothetical protein